MSDPENLKALDEPQRFSRRERDKESQYGTTTSDRAMRFVTEADVLTQLFSHHPPTEVTLPRFQAVNQAAKNFAEIVLQNCPPCADRAAAIRQIREARMTANAAIALNGLGL